MSVAFRRDGDEEHLEPKFEIPIPPGPNLVTARGLALIAARVSALEAQLADTQDETAIKSLKRDLRYWQTRQITAQLVPVPSGETVEIGTRVRFRLNGTERTLAIVGDDQDDVIALLSCFETDNTLARFASREAFFSRLDAMINRVANEMDERISQILNHRLINFGFFSDQRQLDVLAQLPREVASDPRVFLEKAPDRLHSGFHHRVLQIGNEQIQLADRLIECMQSL